MDAEIAAHDQKVRELASQWPGEPEMDMAVGHGTRR